LLETVVVLMVAAVAEEKYTRPLELHRFAAAVAISTMLLPHTIETTVVGTLVVVVKEA
jgi:hypothetical protein